MSPSRRKRSKEGATATDELSPAEKIEKEYGDMVYDLCISVLGDTELAHQACRATFKDVRRSLPKEAYSSYVRAWILRIACEKLRAAGIPSGALAPLGSLAESLGAVGNTHRAPRFSPEQEFELAASASVESRLGKIDHYIHRLAPDEQILLLFRDKYGLPYSEIANATGLPEDSIKVRRQQALRALEEWIWEAST